MNVSICTFVHIYTFTWRALTGVIQSHFSSLQTRTHLSDSRWQGSFSKSVYYRRGFLNSSVSKESACNAGDPGLIPGLVCWRRDTLLTPVFLGFLGGLAGKGSACDAGNLGSIPGLGRSSGERERLPTPVFWPSEFHRQYGHRELNTTEWLSLHTAGEMLKSEILIILDIGHS